MSQTECGIFFACFRLCPRQAGRNYGSVLELELATPAKVEEAYEMSCSDRRTA